eukprot:CAMPEP_0184016278 /NCGR_PEP_ID=MMETSP0954-20121128/6835_1 /TAXON_ID=627963 /ORGANISM="Aplanochytrium sp, Strain PBS07" /LENGTH=548 /DNA_ID=CAMNT_0026297271 /DNA_START=141 /DNA_END=1787 /DNA_ORIENTATION=-
MEGGDFPSEWSQGSSLTPSAASWEPSQSKRTPASPTNSLTANAAEFKPKVHSASSQRVNQPNVVPVPQANGAVTYINPEEAAIQQQQYVTQLNNQHANATFIAGPKLEASSCKPIPPRRTYARSNILPDDVRLYFATKTKLLLKEMDPSNPLINEVPREFNLVNPLDDPAKKRGAAGSCGYPTSIYKVVNSNDGHLRRVDNVRSRGLRDVCKQVVQLWSRVRHANVVPLRDALIRRGALFLLHDYFPGAKTLSEFVMSTNGNLLPEPAIWNMVLQLLTAVRAIHRQGMACRGLTPVRVIICGRQRVRIASTGLAHILENNTSMPVRAQMQEDIANLGRLVLVFATMSLQAYHDVQTSVELIRNRFSSDLSNFITQCFRRDCNIHDLLVSSSHHLADHVDEWYSHSDALEEHLCKQLESERLARILIKLGLVNDRPEYGDAWSETGDRYVLKLFRDYVFHQTDDNGKPFLDMGHIIDSLNKLDNGSTERILLTSRDEKSLLVVSFADVQRCLEQAFSKLLPIHLQHAQLRHPGSLHSHAAMMYGYTPQM